MTFLPVPAQDQGLGIAYWLSPLLIHTVIWAIFTVWAGLVLLVPRRHEEDEDDDYLAEEEIESYGAKAAGIVLYLIALVVVIFASLHYALPALIVAGTLCLAGLVVSQLVKLDVKAARLSLGAALLGAILGGVVIAQFIHQSLWKTREQMAVNTLRKIHEAETRYFEKIGVVGDLDKLANRVFGGPELPNNRSQYYIFEIRPDLTSRWVCTARPDTPLPWVIAHFHMGADGVVRYNRGRPASINSPSWLK